MGASRRSRVVLPSSTSCSPSSSASRMWAKYGEPRSTSPGRRAPRSWWRSADWRSHCWRSAAWSSGRVASAIAVRRSSRSWTIESADGAPRGGSSRRAFTWRRSASSSSTIRSGRGLPGLIRSARRAEAAAIRARRHAEQPEKRPAHHLGAAESAPRRDHLDAVRRLLEPAARALDARPLDEARRGDSDGPREHAGEVPLAHRHLGGEHGHGEVAVEVIGDPGLKLAQRLAVRRLHRELGAELRLAARPLEEHDQLARDAERELPSVILLDERQRQVHAGGDAGGRVHGAVADEDGIALDGERGVAARELVASPPVGGHAPAVEQPGLREEERPATHRGEAADAGRHAREPAEQAAVAHRVRHAAPAGDEQRVDATPDVADRAVGDELHARRAHDRARTAGQDLRRVGGAPAIRRLREHLEWPGDVQDLDVGERDDGDPPRSSVRPASGHAAGTTYAARICSSVCRTRSTMYGGAFCGDPVSNGGAGSYSMPSWMPRATSSPAMRATSRSAMSMPADTPAAVIIFPCSTTRSETGVAPNSRSSSRTAQWVVARRPRSSPAAARISEPVQTDVVHVVVSWMRRIHASVAGSRMTRSWPRPPGTTRISARVTSANARSATRPSGCASVRLIPAVSPTNTTSAPGSCRRTS